MHSHHSEQAMWNYIIDSNNAVFALGEDEADYISADILEYLGNLHKTVCTKPKITSLPYSIYGFYR